MSEKYDLTPKVCDDDTVAAETLFRLLEREGCADFVETGTYVGGTSSAVTRRFPEMSVWTMEVQRCLYEEAQKNFAGLGVNSYCGDSVSLMREKVFPFLRERPLFYLDSHISAYNAANTPGLIESYPLRDEIKAIAEVSFLRPIIVIHDFFSPDQPDLHYDADHGHPLNWAYIADVITKVYREPIPRFYNTEATGRRRGVVYIGVEK
jgi:hypothetical protein